MKSNGIVFISLLVVSIIIFQFIKIPTSHAQQSSSTPKDDQIPSDLSLDLKLAQDNPDPNQKAIVASETKQVKIVTSTGEITNLKLQDVVAEQAKTESAKDVDHPEQTTSEQIVPTRVVIEEPKTTNENPTPTNSSPASSEAVVPGTTITSPNDNAAPSDNSTNPNLSAPTPNTDTTTSAEQTPTTTQTSPSAPDVNQPSNPSTNSTNTQPTPQSQTNTVPAENTTPQQPANNSPAAPEQPQQPSSNDNQQQSNSSSTETSGSSGSDQAVDNSAVQGASTGPTSLFQKIINFFINLKD